jgi:hypothetical protein
MREVIYSALVARTLTTAAEPHVLSAQEAARSPSPNANASAVDAHINDHFGCIFGGVS